MPADRTSAVLDFSTNDYLGLRNHPSVRAAAIRAIETYGVGSGGAREIAVGHQLVREFEERIASFKGVLGARMVQSGYAANIGVIPQLAGPGDVVILDQLNHQSSKDGAVLSGAIVVEYRHADMGSLADAAKPARATGARRVLIVTDGVFGMDGDVAPLPDIVALARTYSATVMVDDAHGSGVLGFGRGTVSHFHLEDEVHVQVGTASKAFGVLGGYVATSSQETLDAFATARPVAYSTSLPAHLAAACLAALDIIEREPERIDRLWSNRDQLAHGLQDAGLDIGRSATPIVPVIAGPTEVAVSVGRQLRADGVLASVLVPPKVGAGQARLRFIVTATHSAADIDRAVRLIVAAGHDSGLC